MNSTRTLRGKTIPILYKRTKKKKKSKRRENFLFHESKMRAATFQQSGDKVLLCLVLNSIAIIRCRCASSGGAQVCVLDHFCSVILGT